MDDRGDLNAAIKGIIENHVPIGREGAQSLF
jgi:hypothetical protein